MSLPEISELSEREQDILRLVATGAGNKQIAAQLFISTNTVKVHLRNIFAKIGATSRTEAAMTAIRLGLVPSTAVEAMTDTVAPEKNLAPADTPSLLRDVDDAFQPSPEVERSVPSRLRLSKSQAWLLGAGLLVLVAVLAALVLRLGRPQTARPQAVVTSAPSITALPRWQARMGMPSPRTGLAVVAYNDQLYAIGGESMQGVTGAVERFGTDANTWEALSSKPLPVADIQAVVIGGKIYVPGGRMVSGGLTNTLDIYDPGTNRWEKGAELPTVLSAYAMAAYEGQLYLFGGWDGSQASNLAYVYNPQSDTWAALTPMPTRRGYAGAALAGGKIFVIGGKDDGTGLAVVEVYSPDREGLENPWRTATSMPSGRYGMGISSVANLIYIVCGQGPDDTPQVPLAYNSQKDVWQTFEPPPSNLGSGLGLALSGEYLYAIGGKTGSGLSGDILAYQVVYTVGIPVIIK